MRNFYIEIKTTFKETDSTAFHNRLIEYFGKNNVYEKKADEGDEVAYKITQGELTDEEVVQYFSQIFEEFEDLLPCFVEEIIDVSKKEK